MATVNLGRIKFVWQGAYSGATAYVADDVVSYNGSSYICILASTGNLPTNATYWSQMSSAGTNGTDLTSTLTTQGDIVYRNVSGLARLGAGTSGQFLKTNGAGANPAWATVTSGLLQVKTFRKTSGWSSGNNPTNRVEVAPFDGSAGITPTSTSSLIMVYIHIVVKHGDTWRSGVGRVQFSVDGGSNYTDFGMMTSSTYAGGVGISGNDYAGYFMIPNQNTLNEHKIRFFNMPHDAGHNHSLGNSSDVNEDDNTIRSVYGTGATMTFFEYASSVASLSTTA